MVMFFVRFFLVFFNKLLLNIGGYLGVLYKMLLVFGSALGK